jgi:hypothetical protein
MLLKLPPSANLTMKQINPRSAGPLDGTESAIKQMFDRHSNVLEIHLRYKQPVNSTICSIISEEKVRLSKFACRQEGRWAFATMFAYLIPIAVLFLTAPLVGIITALHGPLALTKILTNVLIGSSVFPYLCFLTVPTFYFLLFVADMKLAWKDDVQATYRGPTHISLSPLSIKLLWKGALAVSIGAMFGWDEIQFVELELPDDDSMSSFPSLAITTKTGNIVHNIPIRLDGFISDEDRLLFLHYIDDHVASECKTAQFRDFLSCKDNTELLLNKLKEQVIRDSIEVDHELSAPEVLIESKEVAGFILNKETTSTERIVVAPAKSKSPIPSSFSSASPEVRAVDRSPEEIHPS